MCMPVPVLVSVVRLPCCALFESSSICYVRLPWCAFLVSENPCICVCLYQVVCLCEPIRWHACMLSCMRGKGEEPICDCGNGWMLQFGGSSLKVPLCPHVGPRQAFDQDQIRGEEGADLLTIHVNAGPYRRLSVLQRCDSCVVSIV